MARTVDELRNDVRTAAGRFEREISAAFTKEDLAAVCERVGCDVDTADRPSKARMRAGILAAVGDREADASGLDRPFRKAELESIADALDA